LTQKKTKIKTKSVGQVKERTVMELARFRAEIPRDFETDRKRAYPKFDSQKNMTEHTKQAAISFFSRDSTPVTGIRVTIWKSAPSIVSSRCVLALFVWPFSLFVRQDVLILRLLVRWISFCSLVERFRVGRVSLVVPSRSSQFLSIASSSISYRVFFSFR